MLVFDEVAALARQQYGTITRAQMHRLGISDRRIEGLVHAGVIDRSARGVYVLAGREPTWRQRIAVALHVGGPLAVASHRTAAALWRLDRFRPGHVEVTSPWHGARTGTSTTLHRSLVLPDRDRTVIDRLIVTSPTRTLVDMGRYVGAARLGSMIDDAVRRELTSYEDLGHRCAELGRSGRNGIATVRAALAQRPGGAPVPGSPLETEVHQLVVRAGLPEPVAQHRVDCGEITYVLDLAWPDELFAIECEGFRFHRTPDQLDRDDRRSNELGLRGWLVQFATWNMLRDEPSRIVDDARRALQMRTER